MPENIYQSPRSNVADVNNEKSAEPKLVSAVLLIFVATIVVALLVAGIEYLIERTLPGEVFYSTYLPLFFTGFFFAHRRKSGTSTKFKIRVLALWLTISVVLSALLVYFVEINLFEIVTTMGRYVLLLFAGLLVMLAVSYWALVFGEKTALRIVSMQTQR